MFHVCSIEILTKYLDYFRRRSPNVHVFDLGADHSYPRSVMAPPLVHEFMDSKSVLRWKGWPLLGWSRREFSNTLDTWLSLTRSLSCATSVTGHTFIIRSQADSHTTGNAYFYASQQYSSSSQAPATVACVLCAPERLASDVLRTGAATEWQRARGRQQWGG